MNYRIESRSARLVFESETERLGLLTGRAGLALLSFLSSGKTTGGEKREAAARRVPYSFPADGERNSEEYAAARRHLSYLVEHVYEAESLSFSEGLLGIGWLLEFLTQEQYIAPEYDSVLKEIDDLVYRWVAFRTSLPMTLDTGYIGCFLYFYYRLKGRGRSLTFYQELALKECLILVVGRLYKEARKQDKAVFTGPAWLQIHLLAAKFALLHIQDKIARKLLEETVGWLRRHPEIVRSSPAAFFSCCGPERKCLAKTSGGFLPAALRAALRRNGYLVPSRFVG